jgi:hypothetical protein
VPLIERVIHPVMVFLIQHTGLPPMIVLVVSSIVGADGQGGACRLIGSDLVPVRTGPEPYNDHHPAVGLSCREELSLLTSRDNSGSGGETGYDRPRCVSDLVEPGRDA